MDSKAQKAMKYVERFDEHFIDGVNPKRIKSKKKYNFFTEASSE